MMSGMMKTNVLRLLSLSACMPRARMPSPPASQCCFPPTRRHQSRAGWTAQLVANKLQKPRSLQLDSSGALLVLESGKGVSRITFKDNGGTCLQVDNVQLVVNQTSVS